VGQQDAEHHKDGFFDATTTTIGQIVHLHKCLKKETNGAIFVLLLYLFLSLLLVNSTLVSPVKRKKKSEKKLPTTSLSLSLSLSRSLSLSFSLVRRLILHNGPNIFPSYLLKERIKSEAFVQM
jgi:F0F1-type ATP synthase membrane subunit a